MRFPTLRAFALSLPHATVIKQWGETLVFKVGGKMFLIVSLDGELAEAASFKCSPADFSKLTDMDGIIPAPYLARASWVQVQDLDVMPDSVLQAQIRSSYQLVFDSLSKKLRATLK